jgi:hypothetical protein
MTQTPLIISQSREAEADTSAWKIALVGVLGAILSFCSAYFANRFLETGDYGFIWSSLLWSGLFFSVCVLAVFFIKSQRALKSIAFVWGLIPVAFLFPRLITASPSYPLIAALVIYAFMLAAGVRRGASILSNSVRIKFFEVAKSALPKAVTGFLILVSVLFYLNYFEWGKFNEQLGRTLVDQSLVLGEPALKVWLPAVSFADTVQEFFGSLAESQLRNATPDIITRSLSEYQGTFADLPPAQKAMLVSGLANEMRGSLEKFTGPLAPDASMSDAVYQGLRGYIERLPAEMQAWGGILAALLVFAALKGLAFLFYWLIEGFTFIIFKLLLVTNFAHIATEMRAREFIILK